MEVHSFSILLSHHRKLADVWTVNELVNEEKLATAELSVVVRVTFEMV